METDVEEPIEEHQLAKPAAESSREKPTDAPLISDLARFLRRTRALVPVAVVGLFLLALIAFLYFAKLFVMPIVLALFLAFLLKPIVRALTRLRVPTVLGALIVISLFFTGVSIAVTQLLQPAAQWTSKAPETLERLQDRFRIVLRRAERLSRAAAQVQDITKSSSDEPAQKVEVRQPPVLMNTVITFTKSLVAGGIETVVLLFFMLSVGDLFLQKLVKILPTLHDKKKAVGLTNEVQHSISMFLFTITLINSGLGLLVGAAAFFVGLPNPVLWAVLAGVLNFIPYFGPITGVLVLLIAGFMAFESPLRAIVPSVIYLCLHGVESNFVTPMILGRRLTLNPLVIFISLMFWTWMWGIPGALLSIPMLMMLKIVCDHFKPLAPVGEILSG